MPLDLLQADASLNLLFFLNYNYAAYLIIYMSKEKPYMREQEMHIRPEISKTTGLVTTINELLENPVKEPESLALGNIPTLIFSQKISWPKNSDLDMVHYWGIMGVKLEGESLNELIFQISPFKIYGQDYNDIINDWQMPDRQDGYSQSLLQSHRRMLGRSWDIFSRYRRRHYSAINRDEPDYITPLLSWKKIGNKRVWQFRSHLPKDMLHMQDAFLKEPDGIDSESLDTLGGLYVLAYASPEQRGQWPILYGGRVHGPTQTPVLAISKRNSLMESKLLERVEDMIAKSAEI